MKSYKLYTEWVENETYMLEVLGSIIHPYFDGWNYTRQFGVWRGKPESAVVVEIIAPDHQESLINGIAYSICKAFRQEAVLVTGTKLDTATLVSERNIEPLGLVDECACCENCCECRCGKE